MMLSKSIQPAQGGGGEREGRERVFTEISLQNVVSIH